MNLYIFFAKNFNWTKEEFLKSNPRTMKSLILHWRIAHGEIETKEMIEKKNQEAIKCLMT